MNVMLDSSNYTYSGFNYDASLTPSVSSIVPSTVSVGGRYHIWSTLAISNIDISKIIMWAHFLFLFRFELLLFQTSDISK